MRNVNILFLVILDIECKFYINYEECKFCVNETFPSELLSFILTMRNVNGVVGFTHTPIAVRFILTMRNVNGRFQRITIYENGFYINYEECKFEIDHWNLKIYDCFILTMRNVN